MDAISKRLAHITLLILLALTGTTILAKTTVPSLEDQRKLFVEAEKAFDRGDMPGYQQIKAQLTDYPLLPYLVYDEMKKSISSLTSDQAELFLTQYQSTPLAKQFRYAWLREQANKKRWWTYRTFYKPKTGTELQCHYLTALLQTNEKDRAFAKTPDLWLTGKSQPDACDPVFDNWRKAGHLTQALTWKRIELAMENDNLSLARYLSRFLNKSHKHWYEQWVKVYQDPAKNLAMLVPAKKPVDSSKIWLSGFKRLARKDLDQALQVWRKGKRHIQLNDEQIYAAKRYLTLRLLYADHPKAGEYLAAFMPNESDDSFIEKRLRYALSKSDWKSVKTWIEASPDEIKNEERWQYWLAMAMKELGQSKPSIALLEKLAKQRSYHGFLAADQIGAEYNLNHAPVSIDSALTKHISSIPAMLRTRELIALNRHRDAKREWYLTTRSLNNDQLQVAAKLAQSWGWHDQAIFTLAKTNYWEDLELRFPVKHTRQVNQQAARHQLDSAWIFAVIRQESAFGPDAQSHAGAMGLMQLMPATARYVAKKLKQKRPKKWELLSPNLNIKLGTAYLRQVLDQLNNHQVLATAAYNAGPHRVKSWLPEKQLSADRWVETIPFNETRKYTERVMAYSVIYEQRLGKKPTRLDQRMSPIQPENVKTAGSVKIAG